MSIDRSAPALLFHGDHYGTLAVARALGRAGIAVTLADPNPVTRTGASRFVRRRVRCPSDQDSERFIEWLHAFGEREPGHVLFPASDACAWLLSRNAPALARTFRLYTPPFHTILTLLDKKRLDAAAREQGLAVPKTEAPTSRAEVLALEGTLRYPVMLKPRCQAFFLSGDKGGLVASPSELWPRVERYLEDHRFGSEALSVDATLAWPLVQQFFVGAENGIVGLSGFLSRDGGPLVVRAARKVLQRPRRFGIGVCFEAVAVAPEITPMLRSLLEEVGYFGIFEAELVFADGRFHLIDFNPRPYSQIGFDEARGVPLALLHYLGATGQAGPMTELVTASSVETDGAATAYHHRLLLDGLRAGQWVASRLRRTPAEPWTSWLDEHPDRSDAVRAADDPLPVAIDAWKHASQAVRHPRSFVRSFLR